MPYLEEYRKWLNSMYVSDEERGLLLEIMEDEDAVKSRFFAPLEFGTAGLRGIMGPGIHCMNAHVVRQTTQAFANLIRSEGEEACKKGVGVCYDCRHRSPEFAREAACVLAANGIRVHLFDALRPTPELSFAIRHYGLTAGINITASHNPSQYNGYKVYWSDGAQLPPAHAGEVSRQIEKTDIFTGARRMAYEDAVSAGLVTILGEETDEAFLSCVLSQTISPEAAARVADRFKVVYTPFHGAGHRLVPEALRRLGLTQVLCVPEQMVIDGDFPTVKSPNPEDKEGFALAQALAEKEGAGLVIGTDPDADRVGILLSDSKGGFRTLSGNQVGVLLLDYIICARREKGTLPAHAAVVKTIVTTQMANAVGEKNGVEVFDTFTGFKFIAEQIKKLEDEGLYEYIFAYEESYGYLAGNFARDKDAVTASVLIAEMAAHYFEQGMTLFEAMQAMYRKYGWFSEQTLNLVMPGLDGLDKMERIMCLLRGEPPREIGGVKVTRMLDYLSGEAFESDTGTRAQMALSGSNVLGFELSDGTHFLVRPSGTEPKIKIYLLVHAGTEEECGEKLERYARYARTLEGIPN